MSQIKSSTIASASQKPQQLITLVSDAFADAATRELATQPRIAQHVTLDAKKCSSLWLAVGEPVPCRSQIGFELLKNCADDSLDERPQSNIIKEDVQEAPTKNGVSAGDSVSSARINICVEPEASRTSDEIVFCCSVRFGHDSFSLGNSAELYRYSLPNRNSLPSAIPQSKSIALAVASDILTSCT